MDAVSQVVEAINHSEEPSREVQKTAVRQLLERLAETAPGNSVEMRVPPFGAVQCVEGPRHRRGTPANVVECQPWVFLQLAVGSLSFADAVANGQVQASGNRADLSDLLPLVLQPTRIGGKDVTGFLG